MAERLDGIDEIAGGVVENPFEKSRQAFLDVPVPDFRAVGVQGRDVVGAVDLVCRAAEPVMRPGIDIGVHRDAEAVQTVGAVTIEDTIAHHVLRDIAAGTAHHPIDETVVVVLAGLLQIVAGQEMERQAR